MGKNKHRALDSWMIILLAHLLKWRYQPKKRSKSWQRTIREQRERIRSALVKTPSLKVEFNDLSWFEPIWKKAIKQAAQETSLAPALFPKICLWSMAQILASNFYPDGTE